MAVSQNGYGANDWSVITTYVVSDGGRKMALRKGSTGELLAHMVRWFDANIRDIDPGIMDDWSYAERPVRGSTTDLSNHASGTAADVDATRWPLGVQPEAYLTPAEIARIRQQLKVYEGCIRWGGDYTGRKDPMHFEINRDQATCDRVWAKLNANQEAPEMNADEWNKLVGQRIDGNLIPAAQRIEAGVGALIGINGPRHLELMARIGALTEIVKQLAPGKGSPIDMAAVEAVVQKGVAEAIQRIETTVTVKANEA
mgnify:CR=1 FL=1